LAASVRLVYARVHPPAALNVYWALAESLLRDGSLAIDGVKTTLYEPLYPMCIAAARAVLRAPMLVDLMQIGVASIGAALVYRIALTLTEDGRVATLAGALYAIDPLLVREAVGHTESALVTTLLLAFASAFLSAATVAGAALAGVWLGLAVLTRTAVAPLLIVAPALLARSRSVRPALVLFLIAGAIVLPLPLRTHALNGAWWPTRSGVNLYIGNSPHTADLLPADDLDLLQIDADRVVHERLPAVDALPPLEAERTVDRLLTREAWAFMAADPLKTLQRKIVNVGYVFSPRIIPYRQDDGSRPLVDVVAYAVFSTAVLLCAAVGVCVRRRRLSRDAILWAIAATVVVVNVLYVPATRYRAPMEFVLLFYAAAAFERSR
jgi:hypothetical protein